LKERAGAVATLRDADDLAPANRHLARSYAGEAKERRPLGPNHRALVNYGARYPRRGKGVDPRVAEPPCGPTDVAIKPRMIDWHEHIDPQKVIVEPDGSAPASSLYNVDTRPMTCIDVDNVGRLGRPQDNRRRADSQYTYGRPSNTGPRICGEQFGRSARSFFDRPSLG
jgi:hypothetical protein